MRSSTRCPHANLYRPSGLLNSDGLSDKVIPDDNDDFDGWRKAHGQGVGYASEERADEELESLVSWRSKLGFRQVGDQAPGSSRRARGQPLADTDE